MWPACVSEWKLLLQVFLGIRSPSHTYAKRPLMSFFNTVSEGLSYKKSESIDLLEKKVCKNNCHKNDVFQKHLAHKLALESHLVLQVLLEFVAPGAHDVACMCL